MKIIAALGAFGFFLGGLVLLGYAAIYPRGFDLTTASAIQAQQVYVQASFYAIGGVGALLAAVVCMLSVVEQRIQDVVNATVIMHAKDAVVTAPGVSAEAG